MARSRAPRNWPALLEEYRSSGETQAEFCRVRGLALSTLNLKLRDSGKPKMFVKVGSQERIELEPKDGTLIRVAATDLRLVLKALSDNASA